jgi:hypothetical protein
MNGDAGDGEGRQQRGVGSRLGHQMGQDRRRCHDEGGTRFQLVAGGRDGDGHARLNHRLFQNRLLLVEGADADRRRDGAFAHEAEVGLDATRLIDRAGANRSARSVVEAPANDQNVKTLAAGERRGDRGRVGDNGQRLPIRQRPGDRKIGRSRVDKHGVAAGYDGAAARAKAASRAGACASRSLRVVDAGEIDKAPP